MMECKYCEELHEKEEMILDECCDDCGTYCDYCGYFFPYCDIITGASEEKICLDCCNQHYINYNDFYYPKDECIEINGELFPEDLL